MGESRVGRGIQPVRPDGFPLSRVQCSKMGCAPARGLPDLIQLQRPENDTVQGTFCFKRKAVLLVLLSNPIDQLLELSGAETRRQHACCACLLNPVPASNRTFCFAVSRLYPSYFKINSCTAGPEIFGVFLLFSGSRLPLHRHSHRSFWSYAPIIGTDLQ